MEEVSVVLTDLPELEDFRFEYSIALDKSVDDINAFSLAHKRCFIFIFYTGPVADVPDCNCEKFVHPDYIMRPIYIGNLKPKEKYPDLIRQHVDLTFGTAIIHVREIPFD